MSAVTIYKDDTGRLVGMGQKGHRAWQRFRAAVADLEIGETLDFSWRKPRSPRFHRLYFVLLHDLFDRQEQFQSVDQLRAWLTVGAGYADFVPGPDGRAVALPKSIAWARMDDNEFSELFAATWQFLRSRHAQQFLWPHIDPDVSAHSVDEMLAGYEA